MRMLSCLGNKSTSFALCSINATDIAAITNCSIICLHGIPMGIYTRSLIMKSSRGRCSDYITTLSGGGVDSTATITSSSSSL